MGRIGFLFRESCQLCGLSPFADTRCRPEAEVGLRLLSCERFVETTPIGPDVRPFVGALRARLLGAHIRSGSEDDARGRATCDRRRL